MHANPERVRAICDLSPPTDVTSLMRFMGMINFLGRYFSRLSNTCQPLNLLLRADTCWTW